MIDYKLFRAYCEIYEVNKEIIEKKDLDPLLNIPIEVDQYNSILQKNKIVDETLALIENKDKVFAEILRASLIRHEDRDQWGSQQKIGISARTISRRYPVKKWEEIYNGLLGRGI